MKSARLRTALLGVALAVGMWFTLEALAPTRHPTPSAFAGAAGTPTAGAGPSAGVVPDAPSRPAPPQAASDESPLRRVIDAPGEPRSAGSKPTPPELLRLRRVRWDDVTVGEAVADLVGRTGLRLRMSAAVRRQLEGVRVTLRSEGEFASHVLARLLQPYELGYSARTHEVHIFRDDD